MRLISVIGIFLALVSTIAFAGLLSEKEVSWEKIIGYNHPTILSYFDKNSLSTSNTDVGKVSFGNVLITRNKIEEVPINGTILKVQSVVRMVMMNCDSGITIPVADIFFDVKFPTNDSKPVRIYMFDGTTGIETSNKKSVLYGLLCPNYI